MDSQVASNSSETRASAETREASQPRHSHSHFRRRRVLWALGLESASERTQSVEEIRS